VIYFGGGEGGDSVTTKFSRILSGWPRVHHWGSYDGDGVSLWTSGPS